MMKRTYFLVLVLEDLIGIHRIIQFHLLWHYWLAHTPTSWGIDLDYCDVEWLALEMNRDHPVIFEVAPKHCILISLVDYEGYFFSSMGFLPTIGDIMVI